MSATLAQIFALNPTTTIGDNDLFYLVQNPYTPGADAAILGSDLKALFLQSSNNLSDVPNDAMARSNLGLVIGTDVQAWSAVLDSVTASTYTGSASITTLGAIATGTWNATPIGGQYGGTGVNNGASTITIGGNLSFVGAFTFAGTLTGNTAVTFPTSGTLATTTGTIANATNIGITDDTTTNAVMYPTWVTANSGSLPAKVTSTKLSFNPSTGTLSATVFSGSLAASNITGVLGSDHGGTGVNNGSNTLTLAGNLATAGAFASTFTMTGVTSVTFPTSGTLATTTGTLATVKTQTITSTGAFSYTASAGTIAAIFELQAGGGGSSGTTGAASQSAAGGSGGGGGYLRILVTGSTNLANITGSVGIAGTAGTSGNNNGGTGGNTTLVINSGTTWTAGGGVGGTGKTSSGSAQVGGAPGAGGTNTTGTNGTLILNVPGQNGTQGFSNGTNTIVALGPAGGNSFIGKGGAASYSATGTVATNYGGGAGGSLNGSGANAAGSAGTQGVVVITEFTNQ